MSKIKNYDHLIFLKTIDFDQPLPRFLTPYPPPVGGQFGTGQFGTNIIKTDNLAPDNLAPGQFGTNIIKHTIWHQEKNDIQIIV